MSGDRGGASGKEPGRAALAGSPEGRAVSNPIGTCVVVAVLALVFAAQWWGGVAGEEGSGYAVYLVGGLHAASVWEGEVFRIFTAPLLHLHIYHFTFNLAGLLGVGAALESQVGQARFLWVAALSTLAGSIAGVAMPPAGGVLVGASGAVFGTLGAWAALALRQRQSPPPLLGKVRWLVPIVIVVDGTVALLAPQRVGWIAHLGGFVGGMAAMALVSRGAGPIPLGRSSRRMRRALAGLAALFLFAAAVGAERVASGRICEVLERDDLSEAVREGFTQALRDLPVACANLEPEPLSATPADGETPERPRTRSSANRRGP